MVDLGPQVITGGMHLYRVTELGIESALPPPPPKRSKARQRYIDYLDADSGLTFIQWLKARPRSKALANTGFHFMELSILRQICTDTVARGGGAVVLVLPGLSACGNRRLCGTRGPRGELINVNQSGDSVCRFDASAVLRFLDNQ